MKQLKQKIDYELVATDEDKWLWGHERGKKKRSAIETLLENLPEGASLRIHLKTVEAMDFSFMSEFLGTILGLWPNRYVGRALVLMDPSKYLVDNLDAGLKAVNVVALTAGARSWQLVGKTTATDRPTLEVVARLKRATAPEIAKDLGIQLTACNQRLRKLSEAGAIIRSKTAAPTGGEQFVYEWPL